MHIINMEQRNNSRGSEYFGSLDYITA